MYIIYMFIIYMYIFCVCVCVCVCVRVFVCVYVVRESSAKSHACVRACRSERKID